MFDKAVKDLEEEKNHDIEVAIDKEKSSIYSEYMSLLNDNNKQEFLERYTKKAKELYPNITEDSFEMEFKIECLITEDIISENKNYQMRLAKVSERAEAAAQAEFERAKTSLTISFQHQLR